MRTEIDMKCSDLIKSARKRAKLNQRQLAARAGVSRQAISMYEIGLSVPTFRSLVRILRAAGYELRCHPITAQKAALEPLPDELDLQPAADLVAATGATS